MKKRLAMAVLIFITAFIQACLFQFFQIASIRPNVLLILTVAFGLMRGRRDGIWIGLFCGLVMDVCFAGQLGLQGFIYMWIGYGAGCCYRIFYDDDIKTALLLVALGDLVYGCYIYAATYLMRGRIHFFFYLRRIIVPEILYTLILTIFTYHILYRLNKRISRLDKRSIDSLV